MATEFLEDYAASLKDVRTTDKMQVKECNVKHLSKSLQVH
jgi:hypothetical protein